MSTAPTGYSTPKTNWASVDATGPTDFNRIEGNTVAIETGNRTIDSSQVATSNVGTLRQLLDWFANRLKAISGTTNWYDAPPTTLTAAKNHEDATAVHSATSAATPSRLVTRDANGRAQVASPAAAADIARKDNVDAVQANVDIVQANLDALQTSLTSQIKRATIRSMFQ